KGTACARYRTYQTKKKGGKQDCTAKRSRLKSLIDPFLQYSSPYSEPVLGQQPDTAAVFGQLPGVSVFEQLPKVALFGQPLPASVFGQHEEGFSAFFSEGQVTLSGFVFGTSQALLDEQALFNVQPPVEPAPQEGVLVPFDSTERAASAPAASNTRIKSTALQLFQFPEPDEQQSPPEPDESLQLSSCCIFSSFIFTFSFKINVFSFFSAITYLSTILRFH
ncbi:MAG: hypothetical protein ACYS67_11135, partial [Planctomycetota bacterium]